MSWEVGPLAAIESSEGCSSGWQFDCNCLGDPEPEPPSQAIPRNCEILNVCCFILLRFGVVCYSAIDKLMHYQKWGEQIDQEYHVVETIKREPAYLWNLRILISL